MVPPRLPTLLLVAAGVLLGAGAAWFRSWGLLALVVVGGCGLAWYRLQVARSAASEKFFGELGEETRLTGFQGPGDAPAEPPPSTPAPRRGH